MPGISVGFMRKVDVLSKMFPVNGSHLLHSITTGLVSLLGALLSHIKLLFSIIKDDYAKYLHFASF